VALPERFSKGRTRTTRPPEGACARRIVGETTDRMRKNIFAGRLKSRLPAGAKAIRSSVAEWVPVVDPSPVTFDAKYSKHRG
jgi:hypothetical protein